MKPLNNKELKAGKLKFAGLYGISIALIAIIFTGFLAPSHITKKVVAESNKPEQVKIVYVTKAAEEKSTSSFLADSLKSVIDFNLRKIDALNAFIESQKSTISKLQQFEFAPQSKPSVKNSSDKADITKLNKQIEFYDWALRSQVAVTNTLTKENTALKAKIASLDKNNR